MATPTDKDTKWAKYYENQKKFWYDPKIHWAIKLVVRLVELHRSDSRGWSLSIRKISALLGIATNTALKAVNAAVDAGYLEASKRTPRKRRKLRLSVSLRAPIEYETSGNSSLSQWEAQPVSPTITPTVSLVKSVNIKEISKANVNDSQESQLRKNEGESQKSPPYKESEAYRRFIQRRKELGLWTKKF